MNENILKMYFENKMKQTEIAEKLKISKYKVSRVVTKDSRYQQEKDNRKLENKNKHNERTKEYIRNKRKNNNLHNDYEILKQMHNQASKELSRGAKNISNRAYRDWNVSAYKYNKQNKCYELKKGIVTGIDIHKRIKWTIN